LYDDQYHWVRKNVGAVPVQSISGGTDIVGCFVLGNPNLPVYAGESQCRSFGLDVRAFASPAHIPSVIVDIPEIPVTHSGKHSERAATEALKGNEAANLSALRNPESLKEIAARVAAYDARAAAPSSVLTVNATTLEKELTRIWERVLGIS